MIERLAGGRFHMANCFVTMAKRAHLREFKIALSMKPGKVQTIRRSAKYLTWIPRPYSPPADMISVVIPVYNEAVICRHCGLASRLSWAIADVHGKWYSSMTVPPTIRSR